MEPFSPQVKWEKVRELVDTGVFQPNRAILIPWKLKAKVPRSDVVLRVLLYQGDNLEPSDDDGFCDAYVECSWHGGKRKRSSVRKVLVGAMVGG